MSQSCFFTYMLWLFAQTAKAAIHTHKQASVHAAYPARPVSYKAVALRSMPHVGEPFTQGLEISNDGKMLIESSGAFPEGTQSYIRAINPQSGDTLWKAMDGVGKSFLEGITQLRSNGHWYASIYQAPRKTLEYDHNFKYLAEHPYYFDGWGLSRSVDGTSFIATNGSSTVMTLKRDSFELESFKHIKCGNYFVAGLNELELVDNFMNLGPRLLSNIYCTRFVIIVDPSIMECTGVFSLDDIGEPIEHGENSGTHVANGIAYNKTSNTYFVTGKNWASMFEVRLEEDLSDSGWLKLKTAMQNDSIGQIFESVGAGNYLRKPTTWLQRSGGRPRSTLPREFQ